MVSFKGLVDNDNHILTAEMGSFAVLEHQKDFTVSPQAAMREYFMSKMNVRQKQLLIKLKEGNSAILQAGAMQWMAGDVFATTGIKGAGDLFGKMIKGAVTKESAIKPEYKGNGIVVLEPTYKYILLEDVSNWEGGLVMEDGMFLACEGSVKPTIQSRSNLSSAALGNEGLFNLKVVGKGCCALESNVAKEQLVEVILENDVLRVDGPLAVCWSGSLSFTVERSGKTLIGSAASGEGLVNVYKGTGRVLLSPLENSTFPISGV